MIKASMKAICIKCFWALPPCWTYGINFAETHVQLTHLKATCFELNKVASGHIILRVAPQTIKQIATEF